MPAATSLACKGSIATQPSEVVVFVVVVRSRSTPRGRVDFLTAFRRPTSDLLAENFPKRHADSRHHVIHGSVKQARVFSMFTAQLVLTTLSPPFQDSLRSMAAHRLPNEIWLCIFELSTVEYLPSGELPNSMDRSAWFKNVFDAWCLQSPDELVMSAQKKRYKTVKVCCTSLVGARGNLN